MAIPYATLLRGGLYALAPLALLSCGYALVGRASTIPEDVRAVYIHPLENETSRSQVEQILTRAIGDELVMRRRFDIVSEPAEADAELLGSVTAFGVTPISFDADGRATEYEIAINVGMLFRRVQEGVPPEEAEMLWKSDRYVFRQTYQAELDSLAFFDQEDLAIQEVAEVFAETLVTDLLEGF